MKKSGSSTNHEILIIAANLIRRAGAALPRRRRSSARTTTATRHLTALPPACYPSTGGNSAVALDHFKFKLKFYLFHSYHCSQSNPDYDCDLDPNQTLILGMAQPPRQRSRCARCSPQSSHFTEKISEHRCWQSYGVSMKVITMQNDENRRYTITQPR